METKGETGNKKERRVVAMESERASGCDMWNTIGEVKEWVSFGCDK